MSNGNLPEQIVFRIRRFAPGRDQEPVWKEYPIAYEAGMTVLDGLWKIKESIDPTLAWRASCRMGVCGSCGAVTPLPNCWACTVKHATGRRQTTNGS